ncbi:MAG TPA: hypothetical protein DET40_01725 [Lentisphaeria bacterium]|nr:MAG: hypothetical protein A2X45_16995 [Lentisphaerae bacterium GWF2_50_93]HCE42252.1 hypothetical protein [Lentisphaeria bacterium]
MGKSFKNISQAVKTGYHDNALTGDAALRRGIKPYLRSVLLPELKKKAPYFNIEAVRKMLKEKGIEVDNATLKDYFYDYMSAGVIHDAGRGWYSGIAEPFKLDTGPVKDFIRRVEKAFPHLEFSCWSTEQINPYMSHLLAKFATFIYVDRDLMQSVVDEIRTWKGYTVYLNPSSKDAEKTFRIEQKTIVIRPETSEAPGTGESHAAPIEKLLVDLAIEVEKLPILSRGQFQEMAWRAVSSARISMGTLSRYAKRNHRELKELFDNKLTD